jgi:hypothetical protein
MPKKCIILRISSLCIIRLLPNANTCLIDALVWCNKLLIFGLLNAKFGLPMASLKSIDQILFKSWNSFTNNDLDTIHKFAHKINLSMMNGIKHREKKMVYRKPMIFIL